MARQVFSMSSDTTFAPSIAMNDFLAAFDLDRANIKTIDIFHEQGGLIIYLELNPSLHQCPVCSSYTDKVKGYQLKKIKHSILNPVPCVIHYRARRYICPACGKTFYEHNPISFGHLKVSVATVYNVLQELRRPEATFTYVGSKYNLSPSSVSNIFDKHVDISRRKLPMCISFDEVYAFKSKDSDYVLVLLDYLDKKIIDLLPSRRKRYLSDYFFKIPLAEREEVKYCSFDMWETYRLISKLMFPNSVGIVDKYHVLSDFTKKMNSVRISIMNKNKLVYDTYKQKKKQLNKQHKKLDPKEYQAYTTAHKNYYLLKKFHFLLLLNNPKAMDPNKEKKYNSVLERYCNFYDLYEMILTIDPVLKEVLEIKDILYDFYSNSTYETAKKELEDIIILCRTSTIQAMQNFSKILVNWKKEIINSFIILPNTNRKMNNALIENRNKTIKLLKHSSNGYTNWSRFRNRALFVLNEDASIKV